MGAKDKQAAKNGMPLGKGGDKADSKKKPFGKSASRNSSRKGGK